MSQSSKGKVVELTEQQIKLAEWWNSLDFSSLSFPGLKVLKTAEDNNDADRKVYKFNLHHQVVIYNRFDDNPCTHLCFIITKDKVKYLRKELTKLKLKSKITTIRHQTSQKIYMGTYPRDGFEELYQHCLILDDKITREELGCLGATDGYNPKLTQECLFDPERPGIIEKYDRDEFLETDFVKVKLTIKAKASTEKFDQLKKLIEFLFFN